MEDGNYMNSLRNLKEKRFLKKSQFSEKVNFIIEKLMKTKNGFSQNTLYAVISGKYLYNLYTKSMNGKAFLVLHVGEKKHFSLKFQPLRRVFYSIVSPLKCCICILL